MFNGKGVTTPVNQGAPANEGKPNSVIGAMKAQIVLVEYFDQNGRRTFDALLEANGEWYRPGNSIEWASSLKKVSPWLAGGVTKILPSDNVQVSDAVEILPES